MNDSFAYQPHLRQDLDALRFEVLDDMAQVAITQVECSRLAARIAEYEHGRSEAEVEARSAAVLEAVRKQLRRFKEWPFRWQEWDDPFDPDRMEDSRNPAFVRAVVWELYRDFNEWPTWREVCRRLVSLLEIGAEQASDAAIGATKDEDTGVRAVFPSHMFARSHRCDDMADWRWILTADEMVLEEVRYQWRLLLGEDGLKYRTALTLLMDPKPFALVA